MPANEAEDSTLPFHLKGNFAPVMEELTVTDLAVTGAIPTELSGTYIRNGSNPKTGSSPHWFFGDGMVHGVRLENGGACPLVSQSLGADAEARGRPGSPSTPPKR